MARAKHQFEDPGSKQTLADGLEEYFASNPGLKRDSQLMSEAAKQFFKGHDTVHVVYGCGTSMPDEAIVKIVSLFGTTEGFAVLRGYVHHETFDIYRKLPLPGTMAAILLSPFLLMRSIIRCMRQPKRWPWLEHQEYMNAPLYRIREEFQILVAHAKQNGAA
jgi:hypothetical protein